MQNSNSPIECWIQPLIARDLPAVCALERAAGLSTLGETGWQQRLANPTSLSLVVFQSSDNELARIADAVGRVNADVANVGAFAEVNEGGMLVGLFAGWVVLDEFEVDNVVVAASARRQGIGRALLAEALRQARQRGTRTAFLDVRASNLAALRLYESAGFRQSGRRRGYYREPVEDALQLSLDIA